MRGNFSLIFYPSLYFLSLPSFPIPIPLLTMDGNQIRYKGIGRQLTVNLRPLTSPWLVGLVDKTLPQPTKNFIPVLPNPRVRKNA